MNNGCRKPKVPGRGWAYTGTVLGGTASIAIKLPPNRPTPTTVNGQPVKANR
jgi:hypothetical protein